MGNRNFKSAEDLPTIEDIKHSPKLSPSEVASLGLVSNTVYATLSAHAYKQGEAANETDRRQEVVLPKGWEVLLDCTSFQLDREGYFAIAYVNRSIKHCVIAQRGTAEVLGLRAGVWVYFDEPTIQFSLAEEFSKQVKHNLQNHIDEQEWVISYTGHSLGAVIATARAVEDHTYAVVFESPGSRSFLQKVLNSEISDANGSVITFLSPPNPINSLKPHCGYLVMIPSLAAVLPTSLLLAPAAAPEGPAGTSKDTTPPPPPPSYKTVFSSARFKIPSIRPQEYLRGYMLRGVGMGVPELQQYVTKVEPVIREMVEHTYQVHSIHTIAAYFAKGEEQDGERLVLRWPSHLMQFMEYYNTSRAIEDPDNQSMYVFSAYQAMLKRLYHTIDRPVDRIPLRYIHRECIDFLERWKELSVEERHALHIGLSHHKALNTISIEEGFLVSQVMTGLQAKQYLMVLVQRSGIRVPPRRRSRL